MEEKQKFSEDRVTGREKMGFALVNIGNIPITALTSAFLLIFYTNVVGLDPAACATLFLIARVFDGLNDPFIGYFIDHLPNTKWGHFRPPLMIGTVLCSVNFLLLWIGPLFSPVFKLGIAYITYLLLGVLFPVMDISLNSLLPVMTTDMGERNTLSTIKGVIYMVGMMALNIAAPIVIGDTNEAGGYLSVVAAVFLIVLICSLVGVMGIKERVKPENDKKYSVKEMFLVLGQRPVWIMFLSTLLMTVGMYTSNTVNTYFFTYIIGNFSLFGAASAISMIALFPAMLLSGKLVGIFGKKKLFISGLLCMTLFPLLRLLNIYSLPLIFICTALVGFGQGLTMPLSYGMQADNTDYVQLKTGMRAEAAIASLSSLVLKCAMGIGGALPGYLLAYAGFDSSLETQPELVQKMIVACVLIVPAIFTLVGAVIMGIGYPLDKKALEDQVKQMDELNHDTMRL